MITIEHVDKAWSRFEKLKETAEQYMFTRLMLVDLKFTKFYKDLHENWDEHHAEIFLNGMDVVLFEPLGLESGKPAS